MKDWFTDPRVAQDRLSGFWADLYSGPIALAGGFVRDYLLDLPAKDLDIFVAHDPHANYKLMAEKLRDLLGPDCLIGMVVDAAYVDWNQDISVIYQVLVPQPLGYPFQSVDIIVLKQPTGQTGEEFLKVVCDRVDLRLNAVGCASLCQFQHPDWWRDYEAKRLVVQTTRSNPEDFARQQRRFDRLTAPGAKFEGWSCWVEQEDGSLKPWVKQ